MGRFLCILALVALAASPLVAQDRKAGKHTKLDKIASSNAIFVVKLAEINEIAYSGIVGSRFMFEIEKVVKFEADKDMVKSGVSTFNTLLTRCKNLGSYNVLEYTYEYPSLTGGSGIGPGPQPTKEDQEKLKRNKAAHSALTRLLKKGRKYILAAPSVKAFCSISGVVVPNKWGSILLDEKDTIIVEKHSKTNLKKLEKLLAVGKEKKASSVSEKEIGELIKKLAAESYKEREKAHKELVKIGRPAIEQLKKALESKDAEVQERAKKILAEIDKLDPPTVGGLQVTLKANKKTFRKGDEFVLTVEWKNVGKEDIKVHKMLKSNPLMVLEIQGELAMGIGRWGMPPDPHLLADGPVTIKPGKSVTAKIEGRGWSEPMSMDKNGNMKKETQVGLFDDDHVLGFKTGKYTLTLKTKLADGREVRSKPIKIEIK